MNAFFLSFLLFTLIRLLSLSLSFHTDHSHRSMTQQPPSSYFAASSSCPSSAPSLHQGLPSPTSPVLSASDIPPASTSLSTMDHTPTSTDPNTSTSISAVSTNPMSPSSLSPTTSLKDQRSPSPLPIPSPSPFSGSDPHTTTTTTSTTVPARVTRSGVQRLQQNSTPTPSSTTSSMAPALISPSHLAVADKSVSDCNGAARRARAPSSTSTPPPSPPLAATPPSSSSPSSQLRSVTREMSNQLPRVHSPVSAAAAAAAAASYTSQELAIAYSMVTSTQQDQAPGVENNNRGKEARSPTLPSSPEQPEAPVEGSDALSSLWKKTAPPQEPYFRTRHTISSQHTLSTLSGALFSLDEDQKEFTTDMYIAMRNRIFELEAKTVNYAPFIRTSPKRPADRMAPLDDYQHPISQPNARGYSADMDSSHPSKRPAYHHISHHHPPHPEHPQYMSSANPGSMRTSQRQTTSHPSWYSPETYFSYHRSQHPSHTARHPQTIEREREQRYRASKAQHQIANPLMDSEVHTSGNIASIASVGQSPPRVQRPPIPTGQPPAIQPRPILPNGETSVHGNANRTSPPSHPHRHSAMVESVEAANAAAAAAAAAAQQRQSFHQRQHRAQQQAQSDYSRSYHLQKHMRMMDQKRAAILAQQQQQHLQLQQAPVFKPIQRHYQPHQQMYSSSTKSASIQSQLGVSSLQGMAQQQQHQQRLLQQQQQRQLLLQQQQARQLQYLRQRGMPSGHSSSTGTGLTKPMATPTPSLKVSSPSPSSTAESTPTLKKKPKRPVECFNCMALDSLTWRPRASDSVPSSSVTDGGSVEPSLSSRLASVDGRYLCTACLQYLLAHGHCRPVPPFSVNFLKKIHCLFKKELQVVRFQGWQDAQVLEIEDHITAQDFQLLSVVMGGATIVSDPSVGEGTEGGMPFGTTTEEHEGRVVIKIEDSDDEGVPLTTKAGPRSSSQTKCKEVIKSTFESEAAVGDLFGQRWKTEPMVGYTLVHFGGTDRTRMVPMNPTVPSLTVTFQPESESITFAFRVLVNGLCLLSTGGGPPALHMPEMTDESDESDQEENPQPDQPRSQPPESGLEANGEPRGSDSASTNSSRESTASIALESAADRENVPPTDGSQDMDTS